MSNKTLVMGLGNIILRDEGLGVRAVEQLTARYRLPDNVEAIDGGTLGLALLPYLEGVDDLLIVDAVHSGQQPGTIMRLEGEAIPAALALKMSMHQAGLQDLLAICSIKGWLPPRIVLWGMEPATLEPGLELTPPVASQIDALVEKLVGELTSWGVEVVPLR